MRFTVVFEGYEGADASFGLVFIPCPVWVEGSRELLNLDPTNPHLQVGAAARLLERLAEDSRFPTRPESCTLVVHPDGQGGVEDLAILLDDLIHERVETQIAGCLWKHSSRT